MKILDQIRPRTRRKMLEFSLWTLALLLAISSIPVFAQQTAQPMQPQTVQTIVAEYEMNLLVVLRRAAGLAAENVALQERIRELEKAAQSKPDDKKK